MKTKITLLFLFFIFIGVYGQADYIKRGFRPIETNIDVHPVIRGDTKITDFTLDESNNQIIITKSTENFNAISYGWGSSTIKKVWREFYGVVDGKIKLIKTLEGKIIPEETIPERIEWDTKQNNIPDKG